MNVVKETVKCLKCSYVIVSKHGRDFAECKCKSVKIDGGEARFRIIGDPRDYQVMDNIQ